MSDDVLMRLKFLLIPSILLILFSCSDNLSKSIDLRSGQWSYYLESDAQDYLSIDNKIFQKIEASEIKMYHQFIPDKKGILWLKCDIPVNEIDKNELYSIFSNYITIADQFYINGSYIGGRGKFPPDWFAEWNIPRLYSFPSSLLNENGSNVIHIRLFAQGGNILGDDLYLGLMKDLKPQEVILSIFKVHLHILNSILLIFLSLFFAFVYFHDKKSKDNLWFSMVCLAIVVNSSNSFITMVPGLESIPFSYIAFRKVILTSFILANFAFLSFIRSYLDQKIHKFIRWIIFVPVMIFYVIFLFQTEYQSLNRFQARTELLLIIPQLFVIYMVIKGALKKQRKAFVIAFGAIPFMILGLHDMILPALIDGYTIWLGALPIPLLLILLAFNMARDFITYQVQARNMIEMSPYGILKIDKKGSLTFSNLQFFKLSGYKVEELQTLDQFYEKLNSPSEGELGFKIFKNKWNQLLKGKSDELQWETRIITKSGDSKICEIKMVLINDSTMVLLEDITEKLKTRELMIQSEKIHSIGGLAAGMAHEINNPLGGMIQSLNVLSRRLGIGRKTDKSQQMANDIGLNINKFNEFIERSNVPLLVQVMDESGRRIADIVNNMLTFSRKSDGTKQSSDILKVIDKTLELCLIDFNMKKQYDFKTINVVKEFQDSLPEILCDQSKIQQVLLNLIKNSTQELHDSEIINPKITLSACFQPDEQMVKIEVTDNGNGIENENLVRIFEPFYTTKISGEGTGLGLSVSHYIITDEHKGKMDVSSEPGKGTTFTIGLPV